MHLFAPESQSLITMYLLLTLGELTDNKIPRILFTIYSVLTSPHMTFCLAKALLSPVTLLLTHVSLVTSHEYNNPISHTLLQ